MHERSSRRLGRGLLVLGGGLMLYWAAAQLDARWFQAGLARRLESLGMRTTWTRPLERAIASRREARASGLVGRIEIPHAGISAMIVEGTTAGALRRGVGHVTGTAFPGERGNVGLAGHRDTFFDRLAVVTTGDLIRIRTPDGTFAYQVDSVLIVDPARGELLGASSRPRLTLVTCYPFHWIGSAPERFVVLARGVPPDAGGLPRRERASRAPVATPAPARSRAARGARA